MPETSNKNKCIQYYSQIQNSFKKKDNTLNDILTKYRAESNFQTKCKQKGKLTPDTE